MTLRMKIDGIDQVAAAFQEIGKSATKTAVRNAMKQAAKPMIDTAKARAAVDEGDLKESIIVGGTLMQSQRKYTRRKRREDVQLFIGPNYARGEGKAAPHAHLVEFGTGPRYVKKTKQYVGAMTPRPFMRPAFEAGKNEFIRTFSASLLALIEKAKKRAARRKLKGKSNV